MASWLNEEDTSMDPVVYDVHPVDLVFSVQVGIKSRLDIFHNRMPRIGVVHEVPEARGVNDGQPKTNTIFFNIGAYGLDLDRLWHEFICGPFSLFWWVK